MPSGIPVATVAIDGAANAGILAAKIISVRESALREKIKAYANITNPINHGSYE